MRLTLGGVSPSFGWVSLGSHPHGHADARSSLLDGGAARGGAHHDGAAAPE